MQTGEDSETGGRTARAGAPFRHRAWGGVAETGAALLLYALLAGVFLRPIWRLLRTHLAPDPGDPLLNLYFLAWGMRQLRLGMPDFWNANFFWPLRDALTLSEHLLGPAVQALGLEALFGGPIGAYNALLFTSFPLSGLATYLVLRGSGLGRAAAFAGGLAFAFAPYRWSQLSHFQVLLAQWMPATLWFWDRLLAEPRARHALAFLAFYLLHVTGGAYLAYMIHVPLLALAVNRWPDRRAWLSRPALRALLPTGLLAAGALVALFLPYVEMSRRLDLARGADNFRTFGANLAALLTPAQWNVYLPAVEGPLRALYRAPGGGWLAEKSLFPGWLPAALAAAALVGLWRGLRAPPERPLTAGRRTALGASAGLAAAAFLAVDLYSLGWWPWKASGPLRPGVVYSAGGGLTVLALGCWALLRRRWGGGWPLRLGGVPAWPRGLLAAGVVSLALCFPLFFTPLARVLPGLANMRVPCRFYPFASLAIAYLAGAGVERLRARLPGRWLRGAATGAILVLLAVELAPRPLPWHRIPTRAEFPAVYAWIAGRDDVVALVELPLRDHVEEAIYMYYSTAHWKPIVNGFGGYAPPWYLALREVCCRPMPDAKGLAMLRRMGVTHLVAHEGGLTRGPRRRMAEWRQRLAAGAYPGVREVYRDAAGDRVYEIAPAAAAPSPPAR